MKVYKVDFKFHNDVDLLDVVLSLFSKSVLREEITNKERTVLREYLLNGYSSNTKASLRLSLGIKHSNLNTLNYTLKEKGFLLPHPTNQRLKIVNEQLMNLKNVFLNNDGQKVFLINFLKEDEVR